MEPFETKEANEVDVSAATAFRDDMDAKIFATPFQGRHGHDGRGA